MIKLPYHNSDRVALVNAAFGKTPQFVGSAVEVAETADLDKLTETFKSQMNIVKLEVDEITDAMEKSSYDLLRDAISDVLVTAYGLPYLLGLENTIPDIRDAMTSGFNSVLNKAAKDYRNTMYDLYKIQQPCGPTATRFPVPIEKIGDMRDSVNAAFHHLYAVTDTMLISMRTYRNDDAEASSEIAKEVQIRYVGFCKALGRLLRETYMLGFEVGTQVDTDMAEVCAKLLTRLCPDEDALAKTIRKYTAMGLEVYHEESAIPGYFAVKSSKNQNCSEGEFYPADKFLKSVTKQDPVFGQMAPKGMSCSQLDLV